MKINNITPMAAMLLFVLIGFGSCTNDQDADLTSQKDAVVLGMETSFEAKSSDNKTKKNKTKNGSLKTVDLGVA
ncbi:MAG: hypothetical protein R6V74_08980, partial [Lutibacter sp.]